MLKFMEHLGVKIISRKRKQYSAEFKTKVVLELLQADQGEDFGVQRRTPMGLTEPR